MTNKTLISEATRTKIYAEVKGEVIVIKEESYTGEILYIDRIPVNKMILHHKIINALGIFQSEIKQKEKKGLSREEQEIIVRMFRDGASAEAISRYLGYEKIIIRQYLIQENLLAGVF